MARLTVAEAAEPGVRFIESLSHTKGRWAGNPFKLTKWQRQDIIEPLFGTLNADGTRQYQTAYIELPRKNGKSELASAIALKLLFTDREEGAEIYIGAADRDQASLVFDVAAEMTRRNPDLKRRAKIVPSTKRIIALKTRSFLRAIPADVAGSFGFDAHGIIADELHAWPKRDLWDALTTSTGSRRQPLVVAITTAGYDRNSICWEQHEYARQVLSGTVRDPSFFAYIRAAGEDEDWTDEKVWKACNPALGDFRSIREMRQLARRAKVVPALQNTFRRLYLNQWTHQATRWLDLDLWDSQPGVMSEEALRGRECYGGLDLSTVKDLAAWVMIFPRDDDKEMVDVVARFWCPEDRLTDSENRYRDSYQVWARQGWLTTTPGNAIDYAFIRERVLEDVATFALVDINVDRLFQGHQIAMELAEELGPNRVFGMGQGFLSMAMPTNELERRLLSHKICHGGNSVLRWMADNVAVKQDPAGNHKPDKVASEGKIDGIVALIMALEREMKHREERSRYEDEGAEIAAV